MRNFRFIFWYFGFLPLQKKNWNLTVRQGYGFFRVLAGMIRESSHKLPCSDENREGFAVHSST